MLGRDGHLHSRQPQRLIPVTLTKVNRWMAEGRKAFLERFAAIYGHTA